MAKKNYTWKLDEDLVYKIQKLAEKGVSAEIVQQMMEIELSNTITAHPTSPLSKQLNELQSMRLQMENQQKRSWIFGSLMAILLSIAIIAPWYVSILLIVFSSLLAVWRVVK